ncbi:sugar-transfer associated ATP-grasp domain-containing protein [Aquimarina longa]|uniref:sugar-transfer associated ATP-grasp domain-containing protein n=1 Tax=Aquimarina longa TaxID=1080221 RepID=UPI000781D4E9|nr:sugar-transfer associated ATP-grasp domain-containing protein [Aquimarina longa]
MKTKLFLLHKRLLVILQDDNRKGFFQIIKEAIIFWIAKKEFPYFYFGKFLYRKNVKNYTEYLSSKEVDKITLSKNLHHFQYSSLLRNKLAFAFYMEKNAMPVPPLISYNLGNTFFYESQMYTIIDNESLYDFFNTVFINTGKKSLFIKSITEMGGTGVYLITQQNLKKEIDSCGAYILANDCIHQEVVIQNDVVNKIYKHSVNTIRFDTYIDKNANIHILSAFMRFGGGGNVIDNGSSGGLYVSVDLEKGTLIGKSHQLMKYGGRQLEAHPDTDVVFHNFEIPYFKESCELIKKAVAYIPDRIIGWDIAISTNGPVIIEGNDNNSFITPDIAYGGYLKHPMFKEIIEEA